MTYMVPSNVRKDAGISVCFFVLLYDASNYLTKLFSPAKKLLCETLRDCAF